MAVDLRILIGCLILGEFQSLFLAYRIKHATS
jgi:hypothetical protein